MLVGGGSLVVIPPDRLYRGLQTPITWVSQCAAAWDELQMTTVVIHDSFPRIQEACMTVKNHPSALFARRLAATTALLGMVAVACGGGGSTVKAGQAKAELSDYCAKSLAIETYPEPDFSQIGSMAPAQRSALIRDFVAKLLPLGEQVLAAAPAELKTDGNVQLEALRKTIQSGDPSAFEEPAFKGAEARTHAFDLANCKWASVNITASEYAYSGVPKKVAPGPLSVQLANKGGEAHELSLFRINDGVTDSVKDIVGLPREEAMKKVTRVGATFVGPGGSDYKVFNLDKGRYGLACFVPQGKDHGGPPHTSEGMYASFSVG